MYMYMCTIKVLMYNYTIKVLFMHNSLYLMDLRLIVGILVVVDLFILIMQLGELMNYS